MFSKLSKLEKCYYYDNVTKVHKGTKTFELKRIKKENSSNEKIWNKKPPLRQISGANLTIWELSLVAMTFRLKK